MELIGAKLKKIRLEKGFSLEEVSKKTKIHLNVLKAIEEGSVVDLSPIYLSGFIKIYCKFLGLDSKEYLPGYKESRTTVKHEGISEAKAKPVSFVQSASAKLGSLKPSRKIQISIIIFLSFLFLAGILLAGKAIMHKLKNNKNGRAKPTTLSQGRPGKSISFSRIQKPQVANVIPKSQILQSSFGNTISGVRLTISARENCWVKVKSDGKLLYHGILKKGRSDSWQAKEKINLYLGNAAAVNLNVNGQVITSLGRKGQVINDILITKTGLVVQR